MSLTRAELKIIEAAEAMRLDPDKAEAAYIARQLVQATLPHKNPGNVPAWSRVNGNLTLGIQPGYDFKTGKSSGYPYGTIPRLLLFWLNTEAVKTKSRRIELGNSLASFMRELDLNPGNGGTGAKRSDAHRLREQMERLFRARITFEVALEKDGRIAEARRDMLVAEETVLWWSEKQPEQGAFWNSWVELGEKFFNEIIASPVPVDMRALKALKRSPLALDLYAWATYTAYQTQKIGQSRFVAWEWLHRQIGAEYSDIKDFAKSARTALRKVQAVYSELGLEYAKGGVKVLPCNPHVRVKLKRPKTVDEKRYP